MGADFFLPIFANPCFLVFVWHFLPVTRNISDFCSWTMSLDRGTNRGTGRYTPPSKYTVSLLIGRTLVILAYEPINGDCVFAGGVYFPVPRSYRSHCANAGNGKVLPDHIT